MKFIILNRGARAAYSLNLSGARLWLAGTVVAGILGVSVIVGYVIAGNQAGLIASNDIIAMQSDLREQRESLLELRTVADEQIDALALRMGELNANVIRLNALGSRLTGMADLEEGEFDFHNPPAVGGPLAPADDTITDVGQLPALLADFVELESTLDGQEQQLAALESLLMDQKLRDRVNPKGRPVKSGWISSFFGKRTDPMTGKASWHRGIDFAGKYGNDVIAVSDGVVSWSGDRYGFGNLVEIKHGNGYVTRYAHNQELLVAVGDQVVQGETIALMGSTGRSTGPHVHFEVWHNGKAVDPAKYVRGH
ncbi:MAG: M23 family metallopeptidase [Gammaproteobacteria bacterium]|nr:M23 family metallopeptidase [Gammaproteobacteria bacterium]MCP4088614.1 M23 family metallopeptidase [Gammaproteobacteria bacterium]MCP4276478.1 M23 family metallopeptidase [Gammaproteobacteria bacterium]MCP4929131.1 M23 family metallopeptidase [Gammaproteobacteria bacterium]